MKILNSILFLVLFASCSKPTISLPEKESSLEHLPVALWYDAETHQADTDFRNGLRDLSPFDRTCLSNVYPKVEYELSKGIPLFKSSSRNYLYCENLDLAPLSSESFTIIIAFIPTNGIELLTVTDGTDEILGIKWLNKEGLIVRTGFSSEALVQRTNSLSLDNDITIIKFVYNKNRSTNTERQELWINDSKADLIPLTSSTINSGEIHNQSPDLTLKASAATEISSLFLFEGELTQEQNRDLNCYLMKKFRTDVLNCI